MDIATIQPRRKALGIKQLVLAQVAGVSMNTLACLECGLNDNPTVRTLGKIEAALDQLEGKAAPKATPATRAAKKIRKGRTAGRPTAKGKRA
jgi:transcriptional regulator with XRE-family HTH domain